MAKNKNHKRLNAGKITHLMDVDGGSIYVMSRFNRVPEFRGVYKSNSGDVSCEFVAWTANRIKAVEKIQRFVASGILDGVMARGRWLNARAEGLDWESDVIKVTKIGYLTVHVRNHVYRPRFHKWDDESDIPTYLGDRWFDTYEEAASCGVAMVDDMLKPTAFSIEIV